MVPGALAGAMRQALMSKLPAATTTGMPASFSARTEASSAGMLAAVSAMNDQFATARRPGCRATSASIQRVPFTMASIVPRMRWQSTIFTSTISASGATPSVVPATAPATAVPCALHTGGPSGKASNPRRTRPASSGCEATTPPSNT